MTAAETATAPPEPTGFLHFTIPVGDLAAGCAFYARLGMKLKARRDDDQMAFLRVGESDQYVILQCPPQPVVAPYPERAEPPIHHAFRLADMAAYRAMKAHLAASSIAIFGEHYRDKGALTPPGRARPRARGG